MSQTKTVTEGDEWTKAALQKLLAALKTNIPENGRMTAYHKGLKTVDWKQVAFPPFSPEACQEKFTQILQKMRKIRSLTELIVEAEDAISTPGQNFKIHLELPKRPSLPSVIFYEENCAEFQKKHPEKSQEKVFKRLTKKYQALPDEEKTQYVQKFKLATKEYSRGMQEFCKQHKNKTPFSPERKTKRKRPSADTIDQDEQSSEDEEDMPPKPPVSGFHLFCQELRLPAHVSSQNWKDLTETQRDEYNTLFKELRRQYLVKLKKYLNTVNKKKQQQILSQKSMKRFRGIKSNITKPEPKMPPRSGFNHFIKEEMVLLKEKYPNPKERLGKASNKWRSLSEEEKMRHKEAACEDFYERRTESEKQLKGLLAAEQKSYLKHKPSKRKNVDKNVSEIPTLSAAVYRPSDSEDEVIENSSGDEEETKSDFEVEEEEEEEEEEEDKDAIMFELY